MKKNLKASKWLLGIFVLLFTVAAGLVISQRNSDCHDFEYNGIYYRIVDDISGRVMVTYKGKDRESYHQEYRGSVVIPDSLTYGNRTYRVTRIDDYAFFGCKEMTSLTIPASVWHVGYDAFSGCVGLKEVHISDLSSWCKLSFYDISDCTGDSPLNFADALYLNGELITDLVVPDDVTKIGSHAFEGYDKLRSVVFHEDVEAIHKSAFLDCTSLSDINFPDSLYYIGPYAFDGTPWYESQPDGVIYIGNHLYKYKGEMPSNTSVVVKDGTETICQSAFDSFKGLTRITLPSSLKEIHDYAFCCCDNLKEIYCKALTPPSINRFYYNFHDEAVLYIPKGRLETFENDDFIESFKNVVEVEF